MKNRAELARYFNELGFKVGAEVGVFDGYYSEVLFQSIPGLKLYAIDCWEVYHGYRDHKFKSRMDLAYQTARERLSPYNCEVIKGFSTDVAKSFGDLLDFVYIDANHKYESVVEDLEVWGNKVQNGGIISGHDYYLTKQGNTGVMRAVDEYAEKHGYELFITDWDNENPVVDDRQPSWYMFKNVA